MPAKIQLLGLVRNTSESRHPRKCGLDGSIGSRYAICMRYAPEEIVELSSGCWSAINGPSFDAFRSRPDGRCTQQVGIQSIPVEASGVLPQAWHLRMRLTATGKRNSAG